MIIVVFFLLISKIIPPTSIVVPLISKYLLIVFIMNILSVFTTCIVIKLYFKNLKFDLVHPWVYELFFNILPLILCIRRPKKLIRFKAEEQLIRPILKKNFIHTKNTFRSNYDLTEENTSTKFLKQSSLYNCEKLYSNLNISNQKYEAKSKGLIKRGQSMKHIEQKKNPDKKHYVTFDNIKITKDVIDASRSIQYISQLMKSKAEMGEVNKNFEFNLELIIFFK